MDETTVLVVGAGPSGLALAITLGHAGVKTVILEKETDVSEDPRGIALTGDAVRIGYQLGVGPALTSKIGHDIGVAYFHHLNFLNPPFMNFNLSLDMLDQSVSNGISQFQPNFERELRAEIAKLPTVDFRPGCEVIGRVEESDGVLVKYKDHTGVAQQIRSSWLVGADGKTGITRKKFLEPEGIKQLVGLYEYEGTWIAANLKITLPTPETHPEFPLWMMGYTPQEVYETFWPPGFHFCNNPERPAVSGRFGPPGATFWRHEYSVEPGDSLDDPTQDLWNRLGPWLVRPQSHFRGSLDQPLEFPRDCVEVMRCRPFRFAAKVANRWYCRRTIIIGDAAHVFPPFGGQGIASGIRDACALGWRLAMMQHAKLSPESCEKLLRGWNLEQRQRIDESLQLTSVNGSVVNQRSWILALLHRWTMRVLWSISGLPGILTRNAFGDSLQFKLCENGFFIPTKGGGRRLAQIWIRGMDNGPPQLSDSVFFRQRSKIALLVLVQDAIELKNIDVRSIFNKAALTEAVISLESVTFLLKSPLGDGTKIDADFFSSVFNICTAADVTAAGITPVNGYNEKSLIRRLGSSARFVIVRPDFFIHSVAADEMELQENARHLLDLVS